MKYDKRRSKYQKAPDAEKKRLNPLVLIACGFGALFIYALWNSISFLYKNTADSSFYDME